MKNYLDKEVVLTEEQESIIQGPANIIVSGAGGTGKTITAIQLANNLSKNASVAVIIYTKALREYIMQLVKENVEVITLFAWNINRRKFDYIIVDEVQDCSIRDVKLIVEFAIKGVYFLGDDMQNLYETGRPGDKQKTVLIAEIAKETNFPIVRLTQNLRCSKNRLKFITTLMPDVTPSISDMNDETSPMLFKADGEREELDFLTEFCKRQSGNTAILLRENKQIRSLHTFLKNKGIKNIGYKIEQDYKLNFNPVSSVNILTIESSKGLEFDNVIIPYIHFYELVSPIDLRPDKRKLYLAFMRSRINLILTMVTLPGIRNEAHFTGKYSSLFAHL